MDVLGLLRVQHEREILERTSGGVLWYQGALLQHLSKVYKAKMVRLL